MSATIEPGARRGRLLSSAINFAHLAGIAPLAPTASAPDRQEPRLSAPAAAEGGKDGDDKPDRHPDGKFRGKKKDADGDDTDEDEDEDGDDETDEKEAAASANPSVRAARMRERTRCAAIFAAPEAAGNAALAAHLAFETSLTRTQAIATLKHGGKGAGGLASRMAAQSTNGIPAGADRPQDRQREVASSWDRVLGAHRRR